MANKEKREEIMEMDKNRQKRGKAKGNQGKSSENQRKQGKTIGNGKRREKKTPEYGAKEGKRGGKKCLQREALGISPVERPFPIPSLLLLFSVFVGAVA